MSEAPSGDAFLQRRVSDLVRRRREILGPGSGAYSLSRLSGGLSDAEYARISKALLRLQRGLTGERALIGVRYMDDPDLLSAYLLFYWPVSYAQVFHALDQSGIRPGRVLDAGSGPGPAAAALLDAGAEAAVLTDSSPKALELARRVLAPEDGGPRGLRFLRLDLERGDPGAAAGFGPYDCVVFGHSLNELWPRAPDRLTRRLALIRSLSGSLDPGGILLVVEPALLTTSREALALRDALAAEGWSIRAPCAGRSCRPCPALAAGPGHTCHDELRWNIPGTVRALAERTGLDKESLKATWFAARPPTPPGSESPAPASAWPGDALRVVSDPLLNKAGRVRFLLCGREGRFPFSAPADSPLARESGFLGLRRGDVLRVRNPEIRERGWGLSPETKIEIL